MNKVIDILKKYETDTKHRPRCILASDYEDLACELQELMSLRIGDAYRDGYISCGVKNLTK
jgi:hypothetical protein